MNTRDLLLNACKVGNVSDVKAAIKNGCDINCVGTMMYPRSHVHHYGLEIVDVSPILVALSYGHLDLAMFLLKAGANLNHVTRDGYNAAHLTAYTWSNNAIEILAWLFFEMNFNFNTKDKNGFDVYAAAKGGGNPLYTARNSNTPYNYSHISLLFDNQFFNRCSALMMFSYAKRLSMRDDGLCDAIIAIEKSISDEIDHLLLVKCMVEYCGHTGIECEVSIGGFNRSSFNGCSAYSLAKEKGYNYIVLYFDKYLAAVASKEQQASIKVKPNEVKSAITNSPKYATNLFKFNERVEKVNLSDPIRRNSF